MVKSGASRMHVTDYDTIRVHYVPVAARFRATTLFMGEVAKTARYIKGLSPDLVHAHGTEDSNLLIAQATRLPYVVTVQALFSQMKKRLKFPVICRQRVTGMLEKISLNKTLFAIAKSEYVQRELQARYPKLEVRLIPNTFDKKLFNAKFGESKQNALAFVGSINHRKGVDLICRAMQKVQDHGQYPELWIMGNNKTNSSLYEKEVIEKLRGLLNNRLKHFGKVDPARLVRLVSQCKGLVAPSREEMFGNQVIEALLAGTHAIVTDQTAMAENITRFGNGTIVPQENSDALAEAMEKALLAMEFPERNIAQENIRAYMGPSAVAQKHFEFYSRIINN